MQVQQRIIETLKLMDEGAILQLYDFALTFQNKKRFVKTNGVDMANIKRSQRILSSIKGSLADDIRMEREDRTC